MSMPDQKKKMEELEEVLRRNRMATLLTAVEYGFRCHEKGWNLQMTLDDARKILEPINSQAQTSAIARNAAEEKL